MLCIRSSRLFLSPALTCAMALVAFASDAQTCPQDPCLITLTDNVVRAELPPEGWLVAQGETVTTVVLTPPLFGQWLQNAYEPTEEFWAAGGDSVTLHILGGTNGPQVRTIVLAAASYDDTESSSVYEDFDQTGGYTANISPGLQLGSPSSTTLTDQESIDGAWSLKAALSNTGGGGTSSASQGGAQGSFVYSDGAMAFNRREAKPAHQPGDVTKALGDETGGGTDGADNMGAGGAVNTTPPPGGATGGFFSTRIFSLGQLAGVDLRDGSDPGDAVASLRLCPVLQAASFDSAVPDLNCYAVAPGTTYDISLGYGMGTIGHPADDGWQFTFKIAPEDNSWSDHEQVTQLAHKAGTNIQATSADDSGTGDVSGRSVYYDRVKTWRQGILINQNIIAERFEGGLWNGYWAAGGPVATELESGSTTEWRGVVDLTDLTATSDATLTTADPSSSRRMWLRMDAELSSALTDQTKVRLVETGSLDGVPGGGRTMDVVSKKINNQQTKLRVRIFDDAGQLHMSPWLTVDDNAFTLTVSWWAETDSQDGGATLRINGEAVSVQAPAVTARLDSVSVGVTSWAQGGINPLNNDVNVYFDNVTLIY